MAEPPHHPQKQQNIFPIDLESSTESDVKEVPEHLRVTDTELAGSILGSAEATAAALQTHRRAESNYAPELQFRRHRYHQQHQPSPGHTSTFHYGDLISFVHPDTP